MKLVIDTNILISALIKNSLTRRMIMNLDIELFSPEYLHVEMKKYDDELIHLTGLAPTIYYLAKNELLSRITVVPSTEYALYFEESLEMMKGIDENDSSFIAVALALDLDGIWSNDKDLLRQKKVKVWNTKELMDHIEKTI